MLLVDLHTVIRRLPAMPGTVEHPTTCLVTDDGPRGMRALAVGRVTMDGAFMQCAAEEGLPELRHGDVVLLDLAPTHPRLRELLQEVDALPAHQRPRVMLCGSAGDPALRILARTFNVPLVRRDDVATRWPLHLASMRAAAETHRDRQHIA